MKRVLIFVLGIVLLFAQPLAAQNFWRGVAATFGVQVDLPAVRQLGFDIRGHHMVVTNGVPFFCRVVVGGTEVASLGPGDIASDNRKWEPLTPQLPIVALCYTDEKMTQYVGAAGRVFTIWGGGQPISVQWTIRLGDLQKPDGSYVSYGYGTTPVYPSTAVATRHVEFPREWWNATAGLQLTNNTLFVGHVRINGRDRGTFATGEVFFSAQRELLFPGRQNTIQVVFTDGGRFVGATEFSVWVPSEGILAYQTIIGPYHIQR